MWKQGKVEVGLPEIGRSEVGVGFFQRLLKLEEVEVKLALNISLGIRRS